MDVATADRFFALMTLAALTGVFAAAALATAGRFSAAAARARHGLWQALDGPALWLAWLIATGSMLGSLYYSEIVHYAPCSLCWYQRIAGYPLVAILLIAAVRRDRNVRVYALPLVLIGGLIAAYQYLLGYLPTTEILGCSIDVSCTERYIWEFGFVDFPFMSLVSFAAIGCLLWCSSTRPGDGT